MELLFSIKSVAGFKGTNGKKIIGGLFTREMLVFKALQPRPKGFTPPSSTRTI